MVLQLTDITIKCEEKYCMNIMKPGNELFKRHKCNEENRKKTMKKYIKKNKQKTKWSE